MITTKWPALIVVGEEISPQLALEINKALSLIVIVNK